MLVQHRDKIDTVIPGDIIHLHGRTVVVGLEPTKVALAYKGAVHSALEIVGWDVTGMRVLRTLAVPDQHVTITR